MNGIVFDCDGVLVDTEPISEAAWTRVLSRYGYEPSPDDFAWAMGRTSWDAYERFAARVDLPGVGVVLAAVDAAKEACYRKGLPPFPDAAAAVPALASSGLPLAVASSSSRRHLDLKLEACGLGRYFAVTVAGDEVAAGKPAPDLYREAARRLAVDATRCVAVEDTIVGAESAQGAGMRVVVVDRGLQPLDARFAVASSIEVATLVARLPR